MPTVSSPTDAAKRSQNSSTRLRWQKMILIAVQRCPLYESAPEHALAHRQLQVGVRQDRGEVLGLQARARSAVGWASDAGA
jgi:hypothetical protein